MTSNKFKIILLAVVFNLFFEYAVGGVNRIFEKPLTLIWLFFIYFCLFAMLEDLIRRFRITNVQIFVFAWCFGILPELYLTGSIFTEPLILGINWLSFLTINIVWWGTLQSLVTLYFAGRLVRRNWEGKPMGWPGWCLCIAYITFICSVSFATSETLRRGPFEGYIVAILFQLAGAAWLVFSIPKEQRPTWQFESHWLLDAVAFGTVVAFLGIGTFVAGAGAISQEGNMLESDALLYSTLWTFVVFAGVLVFYLVRRRPITV